MLKVNLEQLKYSSGLQGRTLYLVLSTPPPPPRPPCLRSAEGVVPGDLWHSGAAVSGARRESQISREADEERPRPRIRRSVHFHSHLNTGATARTGSRLRYFLSFQDLVTRSAATAAARGPARSAASRARAFSSSSRTTQGWRNHTHTHNPNGAVRAVFTRPVCAAECACPSAPGGSGATGAAAKNATPPASAAAGAAATSAPPVRKAFAWWRTPARARPSAGTATTWTTVTPG